MSLCEWWPEQNRPATGHPGQQCTNEATLSVGADPDNWHLCDTCAGLSRFARKRRRTPLRRSNG